MKKRYWVKRTKPPAHLMSDFGNPAKLKERYIQKSPIRFIPAPPELSDVEVDERVEESLKIKDNEVKLFSITNLDCFLLLKKSNFPKVIDKTIKFYEAKEDYDKCAELIKLKGKVNGTKKGTKGGN